MDEPIDLNDRPQAGMTRRRVNIEFDPPEAIKAITGALFPERAHAAALDNLADAVRELAQAIRDTGLPKPAAHTKPQPPIRWSTDAKG